MTEPKDAIPVVFCDKREGEGYYVIVGTSFDASAAESKSAPSVLTEVPTPARSSSSSPPSTQPREVKRVEEYNPVTKPQNLGSHTQTRNSGRGSDRKVEGDDDDGGDEDDDDGSVVPEPTRDSAPEKPKVTAKVKKESPASRRRREEEENEKAADAFQVELDDMLKQYDRDQSDMMSFIPFRSRDQDGGRHRRRRPVRRVYTERRIPSPPPKSTPERTQQQQQRTSVRGASRPSRRAEPDHSDEWSDW